MNHAFNLLVTVEPDKRLHLSVVDPTWSDVDLVTIQKKKLGIKTA
jgi:hypothetical protein